MAVVDVLDAGGELELGGLEAGGELAVLAMDPLRVGEQADQVRRGQRLARRVRLPLTQGADHPVELHGRQFLERLFDQHTVLLLC